jgi:hypothetical protein
MKTNKFILMALLAGTPGLFAFSQAKVGNTVQTDSVKEVKIAPTDSLQRKDDLRDLEEDLNSISSKEEEDTTKIRIGKLRVEMSDDGSELKIKKDKHRNRDDEEYHWYDEFDEDQGFDPHWGGFSFGPNLYGSGIFKNSIDEPDRYMELNTNKSWEFNWNIGDLGIDFAKERFGLVTGLGLKWNNYKFSNTQMRLNKGTNALEHYTDTIKYDKNKLTVFSLVVPLILEFDIPLHGEDLYIAAGVEGTLKLGSHTKMVTSNNRTTKNRDDFYLNTFNYSTVLRVGYGDWGLYASCGMTSLFKNDQGPELYPFAIGMSLNF